MMPIRQTPPPPTTTDGSPECINKIDGTREEMGGNGFFARREDDFLRAMRRYDAIWWCTAPNGTRLPLADEKGILAS